MPININLLHRIVKKKTTKRHLFWDEESYVQGQLDGWAEGWRLGMLDVIQRQLTRRYGQFSKTQERQFYTFSLDQLTNLAEALMDFRGKTDLNQWFKGQMNAAPRQNKRTKSS